MTKSAGGRPNLGVGPIIRRRENGRRSWRRRRADARTERASLEFAERRTRRRMAVKRFFGTGDVVLLKASRSMRLERHCR